MQYYLMLNIFGNSLCVVLLFTKPLTRSLELQALIREAYHHTKFLFLCVFIQQSSCSCHTSPISHLFSQTDNFKEEIIQLSCVLLPNTNAGA